MRRIEIDQKTFDAIVDNAPWPRIRWFDVLFAKTLFKVRKEEEQCKDKD